MAYRPTSVPDVFEFPAQPTALVTFFVTRAAVREMVRHRLRRIVSISSASAERGGGVNGRAACSGSKAAILGITRTLARELGEFGITVTKRRWVGRGVPAFPAANGLNSDPALVAPVDVLWRHEHINIGSETGV